ncbi:unnamed protein product [Nezara viridula]|uniref:Uncharacterized protein n=1 Tax=Nezara viridula TaxID=85310 RepID=A0A9P0H8X8_NEZVI|nr:unnamed protein product [Nezara viridula]
MKSHYRGHKMAIWLNLIPQLHQPGDQDVSMRHHHFHERASHYYAGAVRPESFTRAPPTTGVPEGGSEPLECPPNSTSDEPLGLSGVEEAQELERNYYSTSTAFGITLGLGCLLLLLNALIFSAIYIQRRRKKRPEPEAVEMKERKPPPPTPPLRTSSVPVTPATVKKRVQIQEISV